jgi:homopolymeric O-antigen transport system ATP-binding protein
VRKPADNADGFALHLSDVGKRYVKYDDVPALLTRALRFGSGARRSHLWALRHLDLDVPQGETLGIIGRNGSGKTTSLRLLAGVTAPTEGSVSVRGRVAPLLSVGVGFHQELSGRENVYLNGSVLGMTRREIDSSFDHIVAFAELAEFIDTPVKFYSTGMWLRLGFSVAVEARPDILLIDEVLAVGDLSFQLKCFERMAELKEQGASVIVVSHNLNAIRNLCSRVLVLDAGTTNFIGPTPEAIAAYHRLLEQTHESAPGSGGGPVRILGAELLGADGEPSSHLPSGEQATLRLDVRFDRAVDEGAFVLVLWTSTGVPVYIDSNYMTGKRAFSAGEQIRCDIGFRVALTTGTYSIHGAVRWGEGEESLTNSPRLLFFVDGRRLVFGVADLDASFEVLSEGVGHVRSPVPADDGRDGGEGR